MHGTSPKSETFTWQVNPSLGQVGTTPVPGWHSSGNQPGDSAPARRFPIGHLAYPRRTTGEHLLGTYPTPSEHAVNACTSSISGRWRTPKANCESRTASEGN